MRLNVLDLGLVSFQEAWNFQKELHSKVRENALPSTLIFCRHFPVITLGRISDENNILVPESELEKERVSIIRTNRGGEVTYHGPGQLILYPLLNLNNFKKDIHWFLRQLEEVVISYLSDYGLKGERLVALTGVWIKRKKISSIGIAVKNWTTFHGLSLNVLSSDLANYKRIRPCGMDLEMTSLEDELGRTIDFSEVKEGLINRFRETFFDKLVPLELGFGRYNFQERKQQKIRRIR